MTDYTIINFDQSLGRITMRVVGHTPIVVDLPIDAEGNVPSGPTLDSFLRGFIPTWADERKAKLAAGISNAADIQALVVPDPTISGQGIDWDGMLRAQRNTLLATCDFTQLIDSPMSDEVKAAWAAYRQQLRDLPEHFTGTPPIVFPDEPVTAVA
jgi:hypothetical protein